MRERKTRPKAMATRTWLACAPTKVSLCIVSLIPLWWRCCRPESSMNIVYEYTAALVITAEIIHSAKSRGSFRSLLRNLLTCQGNCKHQRSKLYHQANSEDEGEDEGECDGQVLPPSPRSESY